MSYIDEMMENQLKNAFAKQTGSTEVDQINFVSDSGSKVVFCYRVWDNQKNEYVSEKIEAYKA